MILEKYFEPKSKSTRTTYLYALTDFARFNSGDDTIKVDNLPDEFWLSIRFDDVMAWRRNLKERNLSPAYIAKSLIALTGLLGEAKREKLYPAEDYENIMDATKKDKKGIVSQGHPEITPADQNLLLETAFDQPEAKGQRDYLILLLLLETGIRRYELVNLLVGNMEIEAGQPQLLVLVAKNDKSRKIPLDWGTYNLIKEWIRDAGLKSDDYLICPVRRQGRKEKARYIALPPKSPKPMSTRWLNDLVKRIVIKSGIESHITPHSFRVSLVTNAVEADAAMLHIQQFTGHSDSRMIKDIYNRHKYNKPLPRKHKLYKPNQEAK